MVPREKALEGAEMVVRAEEFARTNLRVDRTECGDHQPVLLDQGSIRTSPNTISAWMKQGCLSSMPCMPPTNRAR